MQTGVSNPHFDHKGMHPGFPRDQRDPGMSFPCAIERSLKSIDITGPPQDHRHHKGV